jgi:hypothetical protein
MVAWYEHPYKRDNLINDYHIEALQAFDKFCKFNSEDCCKAMAYAYVEEDASAIKVWEDLGLTYKHALIVCNREEDFIDEIYGEMNI